MKWQVAFGITTALGILSPPVVLAQDADARPGIAVWAFRDGGSYGQDAEDFASLQVGLQELLLTELGAHPKLRIVERSRLKEIIAEQDLVSSDRVEANTAAQIGKVVGARYVVMGSFIDFYGDFRLNARIVDVETSEILTTEGIHDKRDKLYDMLVTLAAKLADGVDLPPLPQQVIEQRRQRDIPAEAIAMYSRAVTYEDRGLTGRAIDLYRKIAADYPEMNQARQSLKQLSAALD